MPFVRLVPLAILVTRMILMMGALLVFFPMVIRVLRDAHGLHVLMVAPGLVIGHILSR